MLQSEKQLSEAHTANSAPHEPSQPSHLSRTASINSEAEHQGGG